METTTIWIIEKELSDNSKVFSVEIEGTEFECVTEQDARDFADAFEALVDKHTNITALVMDAN